MGMKGLGSQRSLQAGHDQGCPDSFSGNVADGDAPSPSFERNEIIVVAANSESGLVESLAREARNRKSVRREEGLLYVFGALQVFAQRPGKPGVELGFLEVLEKCFHM